VGVDELLAAGARLEGHVDNLAAALLGGVCVATRRDGAPRAARIADDMPAAAVVAVPGTRTSTAESRTALPSSVSHADAAATAASALLLGAAIGGGDAKLLAGAFDDRLHEPYRADGAPLLAAIRGELPDGALAVTLSGSGPSVVVWAEPARVDAVVDALAALLPAGASLLPLRIAREGAIASQR